jgi:4-amino-4-deoxy-L-arabinose transferase-like glycosyltransferase
MLKMNEIVKNKYVFVCLVFIFLMGVFVRGWKLGEIPVGVNQDEANLAYDAYSIMKIGMDKEGTAYPVHLTSYYGGQGALMAYLSMPFIALLGLNIFAFRLVPCLLAIIAFGMMCILFRKTTSTGRGAIVACLIAATIPESINYARWALEATSLPSLIVIALFFFYYFLEQQKILFLSLGYSVLALASYCYGSAYIIIPIIGFLITCYVLCKRTISFPGLCVALIIPILIALPNLLFVVAHHLKYPSFSFWFFTIPDVKGLTSRISLNFHSLYGKYVFAFQLLYRGFNSMFYYISGPLLFLGFIVALKRREHLDVLFFTIIIAALIMFAFIDISPSRILYLIPAIVYFIAIGAAYLVEKCKYLLLVVVGLYLYYFNTFFDNYFLKRQPRFIIGLDTAAGDAEKYCADKKVFFTNEAPISSALVVFGSKINPALFQQTKWRNHRAFWGDWQKFGRYEVWDTKNEKNKREIDLSACYIVPIHRLHLVNQTHVIIQNPHNRFALAVTKMK